MFINYYYENILLLQFSISCSGGAYIFQIWSYLEEKDDAIWAFYPRIFETLLGWYINKKGEKPNGLSP